MVREAQQKLHGGRMLSLISVHAAALQLHTYTHRGELRCDGCGAATRALEAPQLSALVQALAAAESLGTLASVNAHKKAATAAAAAEAVQTVTAVMRSLDGLRKALGTPPVHQRSAADETTAGEAAEEGSRGGCECCAETVSAMARAMRVLCTVSYEGLKWVAAAEAAPEAAAAAAAAATAFSRAGATAAAAAVTATRLWATRATEQTDELAAVWQCAAACPLLRCAELRWASGSLFNAAVELQRAGGEGGRCERLFRGAWQLAAAATAAAVRDDNGQVRANLTLTLTLTLTIILTITLP